MVKFFKQQKNKINDNQPVQNFSAQQKIYDKKGASDKSLSEDEKMELSWQFLYDITDFVLKKFSKTDLDSLHQIGKELLKFGMSYQHVVEYNISNKKNNVQNIAEEKNIGSNKQASI
jgi:hypothetical protein